MNEQTEKLIRDLSEKLGTSAELLWGALLKQAPITAAMDTIIILLLAAVLVWSYRLIKRKRVDWELDDDLECFIWMGWAALVLLDFVMIACNLTSIVAGFFNPEYWALKQLWTK